MTEENINPTNSYEGKEDQKPSRILICEDDDNLGMLLRDYLESKEYIVDLCTDGEEGLKTFKTGEYNLCILDVMMPKMDGFTLAKEIRKLNENTPFMFMTAKTLIDDIKEGFAIGADDYITKPFNMEQVLCRIGAILRRTKGYKPLNSGIRHFGKYTLDINKQILYYENTERKLTTTEAGLFTVLSNNINTLVERDVALKFVWGSNTNYNARSMDVYITKLRKIIDQDPSVKITNVHGRGYKLVVGEPEEE